ncbi:hypothetical protein IW150_000482 [Coemansia sp. RSA 2607]|nr:hypothetical protein IW150_000482 [Coemansia sp. RSA 2607]
MYVANILFLFVDKAKMTRLHKSYHKKHFENLGGKEEAGKFEVRGTTEEQAKINYYSTRARKLKSYLWESVVVRISWAMIVLAILISDRITDYYLDTMAVDQAKCALAIATFIFIGLFCLAIFLFKSQICPELKDIRKKNKLNWVFLW